MKSKLFAIGIILFGLLQSSAQVSTTMPGRLVKKGKHVQLLVDNKPFLILGGELGNSSASSNEYMRPLWPKLKQMNLNTVIAPVYWELMEPVEGQFDFSLMDSQVINARLYNMKLVILWFGAWKNSMSCYAPAWVKTNTSRFPRAFDKDKSAQEILTPFNKNNLEADKKAFTRLLQHIKEVDSRQNTIIAVQVENEIGMLPDARSYDEAANIAFNRDVPEQMISYLEKNKNNLLPEIKSIQMKYRSRLPIDLARAMNAGGSFVKPWSETEYKPNNRGGGRRDFFERATAMSRRFEMHVTTLAAGLKSHEPHTHRAEEIVLLTQFSSGPDPIQTEMQIGNRFYPAKPGDFYYLGSQILHGIRNTGKAACTYFAFQFE